MTEETVTAEEAALLEVSAALRASYEAEVKATGKITGIVFASAEQWMVLMGPPERTGCMPTGVSIRTAYGKAAIRLATATTH